VSVSSFGFFRDPIKPIQTKNLLFFLSISQVGTAIIHFKKRVRFLEMFLSWKYADKADYDRALATGG